MSWSTSELRVRLAPLNRFKPSSKIFYWPFQGGTSFVDLLCFCSVLCLLCFVRVCLYVLFGHLLGKGWPLGSRLWCLLWVCHFPIGILGQVWYLIVSIPDLCTITYFFLNLSGAYYIYPYVTAWCPVLMNRFLSWYNMSHAREPLYSNSAVIAGWLQSTRAHIVYLAVKKCNIFVTILLLETLFADHIVTYISICKSV